MKLEARVTHFERDNMIGLGTVKLDDDITLNNVRIIQSMEKSDAGFVVGKKVFVAMPSYKTNKLDEQGNPVYASHYNPITAEMKQMFDEVVEMAYGSEDGKAKLERELPEVPEKQGTIQLGKYGVKLTGDKDSNIKGYASVVVDGQFALNGIKLINGNKGMFVALPSYATNNIDEFGKPIYENHYTLSKEAYAKVKEVVLDGYKQALTETKEQSKDAGKLEEPDEKKAAPKRAAAKSKADAVKKPNKAFKAFSR